MHRREVGGFAVLHKILRHLPLYHKISFEYAMDQTININIQNDYSEVGNGMVIILSIIFHYYLQNNKRGTDINWP